MLNFTCKYATVYEPQIKPEISEKSVFSTLCTSRKDKRTDPPTYHNSYWDVVFRGEAFEKAKNLKGGEKIDVTRGAISREKDEKSGKVFLNLVIFEFEFSQLLVN